MKQLFITLRIVLEKDKIMLNGYKRKVRKLNYKNPLTYILLTIIFIPMLVTIGWKESWELIIDSKEWA